VSQFCWICLSFKCCNVSHSAKCIFPEIFDWNEIWKLVSLICSSLKPILCQCGLYLFSFFKKYFSFICVNILKGKCSVGHNPLSTHQVISSPYCFLLLTSSFDASHSSPVGGGKTHTFVYKPPLNLRGRTLIFSVGSSVVWQRYWLNTNYYKEKIERYIFTGQ